MDNSTIRTIGNVGLGIQAFGAIQSTIGSYYGAKMQKSSLQSQAEMQEINARIMEGQAQAELMNGQRQIAALTMQAGQLKSRQRAVLAANGVDLGVGSAAEVQASTDIMKEIDTNQINANAVRSALGMRTQAVNLSNDALLKRTHASSISPMMAAGTSLLGGATAVASSWYKMNKAGVGE